MPKETRTSGPDRRRDLSWWALTPLVTLILGPAVAGSVAVLGFVFGDLGDQPALCGTAATDNRCEETTLALVGQHVTMFGLLWLLLWAMPWWRGLRTARVVLAATACLVLLTLPLRMGIAG